MFYDPSKLLEWQNNQHWVYRTTLEQVIMFFSEKLSFVKKNQLNLIV